MYTNYTYQDWEAAPEYDRPELARKIAEDYKASEDFRKGLTANNYFNGENETVAAKTVLQARKVQYVDDKGRSHARAVPEDVVGNRIGSRFFFRAVTQRSQFLLGNGVTLDDEDIKKRLGLGFDHALEQMGEKALCHGVSWAYWNVDHVEPLYAVVDGNSGFVALLDENTAAPMVGIHFWQLSGDKSQHIRIFETDGVSVYRYHKGQMEEVAPKRPYKVRVYTDALGQAITGAENYAALPIVPFYGNPEKRSELSPAVKEKIDAYDRILSDFGDNLDRANDVYWVLNNFGGTIDDIAEMLSQIQRIKAVANISDGVGSSSTAEPRTIEVPYAARQTALDILRRELTRDMMALDMDSLTGGSLTNVAIQAAMTDLNLACDRLEWQAFACVQGILKLLGVETEKIRFHRQEIINRSEIVEDIQVMRQDIDDETALKLNPYIMPEEIDKILANRDAKILTGLSGTDAANRARGADNGQGDS